MKTDEKVEYIQNKILKEQARSKPKEDEQPSVVS